MSDTRYFDIIVTIFSFAFLTLSCGGSVVGTKCEEDKALCFDGCHNLDLDMDNCGNCGNECMNGEVCMHGLCLPDCGDEIWCGEYCTNLSSDLNHCGECDNACGDSYNCIDGKCELECDTDLLNCNDKCIDPLTDPANCGDCDKECPDAGLCADGGCIEGCGDLTYCDGECVDIAIDKENCGECGFECEKWEFCTHAMCLFRCDDGLTKCGDECVDLFSDSENCGECGFECDQLEICEWGECIKDCQELTLCNEECVDTNTDENHCGECDNPCPPTKTCVQGQCELVCTGVLIECDEKCINPLINSKYCGNCETSCPDGEKCANGKCVVDCGQLTWCASSCVDVSSDNYHCGECDKPCSSGWFCVDGICRIDCPVPYSDCGGVCVDLSVNPLHCGVCNNPCESGICTDNSCRNESAGHFIVIGHDYNEHHLTLQHILGNSIFTSLGNPVKVLAFTEYADNEAGGQVETIDNIIDIEAAFRGRSWVKTTATSVSDITGDLVNYHVLLVYSQVNATDAWLGQTGVQIASALQDFFAVGGIVVLVDSLKGNNGTWQIFNASAVFICTAIVDISGFTALVTEPGDSVAQGISTTYLSSLDSVFFVSSEARVVVEDQATTNPIVIHKIVVP